MAVHVDMSVTTRGKEALLGILLWLMRCRQTLAICGLLALVHFVTAVVFVVNTAPGDNYAWKSFPLDDTWIHLSYARSLAEDGVLGYNRGEWQSGATSPLWAMVLAGVYRLSQLSGIDVVVATKATSTFMLFATSVVLYSTVRRFMADSVIGAVVGLAIAVEPLLAFHKASGMEGPLFSLISALSVWLLLRGSLRWLGICAALMPLARPEGYFALVPVFGVLILEWANYNRQWLLGKWSDWDQWAVPAIMPLVPALLPVGLVFAGQLLFNLAINGTVYPNTYLAKHDSTLGLLDLTNLGYVWTGSVSQTSLFSSPIATSISAFMIAGGSALVIKRNGLRGVAVVLLPWAILYAVSIGARYGPAPWVFWTRRYTDPAIPFLLALYLCGIPAWWTLFRFLTRGAAGTWLMGRGVVPVLALFLLLGVALVPFGQMPKQWAELPSAYAWECERMYDTDVLAAMWIKDNTPKGSVVATWDAGATRFYGERYTIDTVGLNLPGAIGRRWQDVVLEYRPGYAVAWWGQDTESVPNAQVVASMQSLGGGKLVVLKYTWDYTLDDPSRPYAVSVEGLSMVDSLAVVDRASQKQHNYRSGYTSWEPITESKLTGLAAVHDQGKNMPLPGWEEFTLEAEAGKPLTLVSRHEAMTNTYATVFVDGEHVADWMWPKGQYILDETTLRIPPEYIKSSTVRVRIEYDPRQGANVAAPYRYWAYAPD